jgi:hypothetical protein
MTTFSVLRLTFGLQRTMVDRLAGREMRKDIAS